MTKITTERVDDRGAERAFQARMRAQCREIEQYRLSVMRNEGRQLSQDEAALEWIACFAEEFARESSTV